MLSPAALYREAVELLLNVAALSMSAEEWRADAALQRRLRTYQTRAYRAALLARRLAPADDVAFLDEWAGMLLYDQLQDVPPAYDQLRLVHATP
jgi:hypothetical protein